MPVEALTPAGITADAEAHGDLSDVIGHPEAVEALQVAAVGGHHLLMLGPPGAGKTLLATRLPGLLPPLTPLLIPLHPSSMRRSSSFLILNLAAASTPRNATTTSQAR